MKSYIENRKARFNYYIEDEYVSGIVLCGSEVKALRDHKANISEAFCYFKDGELFLKNAHISSSNRLMFSHEEIHDRKLLLTKKELKKLQKQTSIKGYTIVPLCMEIPSNGYIKVKIALCKGKHNYDKRNTIKERDLSKNYD